MMKQYTHLKFGWFKKEVGLPWCQRVGALSFHQTCTFSIELFTFRTSANRNFV